MWRSSRWAAVILALAVTVSSPGQLTESERKGVADALYVANLSLRDLAFERRAFPDDRWRLGLVNLALDSPLEAADALMRLQSAAPPKLSECLALLRREVWAEAAPVPSSAESSVKLPAEIPTPCRVPLQRLVNAMVRANGRVLAATARLSPNERRDLIEGLPRLAWPDYPFSFAKSRLRNQEELLALVERLDLSALRLAAEALALDVESSLAALRSAAAATRFVGRIKFNANGVAVVFAGHGADTHRDLDSMLTVDLGGDDTYLGRHGAGPGYASVLIDLAGNDTYRVGDLSVGSGLLGIGLAWDLAGDDAYRGGGLTFGCGVAGVGTLVDLGGADDLTGKVLSQGIGMFGVGICMNTEGDDRYRVDLLGQGAALVQGAGWMVDLSGNDDYRAGGVYVNSPLFTNVHFSMAQGYATGIREDTGGISGGVGLLSDLSGDDAYVGETYCQGSSYWFALGSLYDASGNDTYRAHHYAQASAMHLCAAYLFDLAGDDAYVVGYGAAHAIGHDYGVAMLLDRAGDDLYAARDSRPGLGNANGLGLFVESAGEDRYLGSPGGANPARGTGSLGVFADLGGPDRYADGLEDGQARSSEQWAVALDAESGGRPSATEIENGRKRPKVGTKTKPADDDMEALYARATRWAVGSAQEDAEKAIDDLIAIGEPALVWMIERKLAGASRLEQRAFVEVAAAVGSPGRAAIAAKIADPSDAIARPALNICVDGAFREAEASLPAALERPTLCRLAARLAGALRAPGCVDALMLQAASKDRIAAVFAVAALAEIADPKSIGTAQALLNSNELPLRKAALNLIAKFPKEALLTAQLLVAGADEREARVGVELLGLLGSSEALLEACKSLSDARPGVRIQALLALDGRCPSAHRAELLELRRDAHPLVRAVAQRIDPGR